MRRPELVIADATYPDDAVERAAAAARGVAVRRAGIGAAAELPAAVGRSEGVLVQLLAVDGALLDACPSLRVLGRYGVGYDDIDVAAATARGIAVVTVPDYASEEVASHAAALILAVARRLPEADRLARGGRWDGLGRAAADGAAVGVHARARRRRPDRLGGGAPGRAAVRHGPRRRPVARGVRRTGIERVELAELLARSDVVSLHLPLTPATRHLIGAEALAAMRPGRRARQRLARRPGRPGRARGGARPRAPALRRARRARPGAAAGRTSRCCARTACCSRTTSRGTPSARCTASATSWPTAARACCAASASPA